VRKLILYAVLFCLALLATKIRRGWNVLPTSRNARGVDIIAYSQDASRMVRLQVKALRDRNSAVPCRRHMVEGRRPVLVDYWIIVSGLGTNDPEFFILTPDEVGQRCFTDSKGEPWLQRNPKDESKGYARPREAWERIGQG
jgi:hypothetical protein